VVRERYARNMKMLSPAENDALAGKRAAVVGCGGLGGFVIEELGRLGVGFITAIDGDVFVESNLNRQLLATTSNLGQAKAEAARLRMQEVNPLVQVSVWNGMLTEENALELLAGHDVILDALDNVPARFLLQKACRELNIPLVHGAIAGWYGQVTTILPGDETLCRLYPPKLQRGTEQELGNPSFTPALTASIQVAEALKILIGRGELLRGVVLRFDLFCQEYLLLEVDNK
jgi:molybdopterin/thiamine biosynthesis adenylyltransferase